MTRPAGISRRTLLGGAAAAAAATTVRPGTAHADGASGEGRPAPQARTSAGWVRGEWVRGASGDGVSVFRGIP